MYPTHDFGDMLNRCSGQQYDGKKDEDSSTSRPKKSLVTPLQGATSRLCRSLSQLGILQNFDLTTMSTAPHCKNLVLDAGPLLSLSPLRGLAATYLTVPQVLDELKDSRAREHFERLGLSAGVKIEVRSPDSASLSHGA